MKTRFRWYGAVFLLALAAASACGRKTTPLIPDSPRPEAAANIKAVTRGAVVYLSLPLPTRNIEGKSIQPSSIRRILIDRAELGQDNKRTRYKRYTEFEVEDLPPASLQNNVATWADVHVRYGQIYVYRIRYESAHGAVSPWSEDVWVLPQASLAAPTGLAAKGADSQTRLTWEPVKTLLDGNPALDFIGYNVYRGTQKGQHDDTPLNRDPLTATAYKDAAAANGQTYFYIVRAVDGPGPYAQESPDSVEASAAPRDLTPPARPKGVTAVPGVERVFLTWNENKENDLAGYSVYRSTRSGKGYERLTEKLLNRTTFSDERVKGGIEYYYVITAVDRSGNESARSEEQKAFVEKLR